MRYKNSFIISGSRRYFNYCYFFFYFPRAVLLKSFCSLIFKINCCLHYCSLPIPIACFRHPNATKRHFLFVSIQPLTIRSRLIFVYVYPFKHILTDSFPSTAGFRKVNLYTLPKTRIDSFRGNSQVFFCPQNPTLYIYIPQSTIVFDSTCNVWIFKRSRSR